MIILDEKFAKMPIRKKHKKIANLYFATISSLLHNDMLHKIIFTKQAISFLLIYCAMGLCHSISTLHVFYELFISLITKALTVAWPRYHSLNKVNDVVGYSNMVL